MIENIQPFPIKLLYGYCTRRSNLKFCFQKDMNYNYQVETLLKNEFGINHITLQIEYKDVRITTTDFLRDKQIATNVVYLFHK